MGNKILNDGYVSKAILTNVRVSPRKARLVADLVRGKKVTTAVDILNYSTKKTAPLLKKLVLSAVANAKQSEGVDIEELFVRSVTVNEGKKNKRFLPRAQGRATPLIKRHSSITVILDEL
ncbi:MAG: 50S ribosomal protein L22 [Deltaproteobacteria bacterium]|nr:50S ribosomal protein L22 [Deltaproteobacteria bacterium]